MDASGDEVVLKGYALSGIEISHTISGDPTEGTNSINKDWLTNMYRWASQCVVGPWHKSAVWHCSAGSGPAALLAPSGDASTAQCCQCLPQSHALLSELHKALDALKGSPSIPLCIASCPACMAAAFQPDGELGLPNLTAPSGVSGLPFAASQHAARPCRGKMMGFNAVRIEWSWDGLNTAPIDFTGGSWQQLIP